MLNNNPVFDFLKYAETTSVKAHTRQQGGKLVHVDAHSREVDEENSEAELKEAKLKALRARQQKELELWIAWDSNGRKTEGLGPLLKSFKPLIMSKAGVYQGKVRIPDSAIQMEFQKQFVNALHSYDPEKGALGTYVYRYLDKGKRWIIENQNTGRIPENRAYKIQTYSNAVEELKEELGRPPEAAETAERVGWSLAEVDRMDSELRSDLVQQAFEEDPYSFSPSKTEEVLRLFKYELSGDQRAVYEHLTGYGRPQITSTNDIAKKLKIKDYQVSRIKGQIEGKLRRHLNE